MSEERLGVRTSVLLRVVLDCWARRGRGLLAQIARVVGVCEGLTLMMATMSP